MSKIGLGDGLGASIHQRLETLLQESQLREVALGESGTVGDAIDRIYKRFINTLDSMLEGCQIIGSDWRYLYLNEAVVKHSRMSRSDLLGKKIESVYPGILDTSLGQAMKKCMVDRIPCELDNEFRYPDGESAWFKLSIQPSDEGIFILSIDITDQKRVESELRSSEKRLRVYIEQVADAVYILDKNRTIIDANTQAYAYSGRIRNQLIGTCIDDVIQFENSRLCPDCGCEPCEGRFVDSMATQLRNGQRAFPVEIRAGAFIVNDERNCLLLVRDISERLRKEELATLLRDLHKRLSLEPNPQALPEICLDVAIRISNAIEGKLLVFDQSRSGWLLLLANQTSLLAITRSLMFALLSRKVHSLRVIALLI